MKMKDCFTGTNWKLGLKVF